MGAYVVERNPSVPNRYTLRSQRLLPENFDQFAHRLDATDRRLCNLLADLNLQHLYKNFKATAKSLQDFTRLLPTHPQRKLILEYIDRRMTEAMDLVEGRALYLMSKDGYPAFRELERRPKAAQIRFEFTRDTQGTRYTARVFLEGKETRLVGTDAVIVTTSPVWLMFDKKVYSFEQEIDGNKLRPFFKTDTVSIPREKETEYYRKFLLKLIEDYEVVAQGFTIDTIESQPKFKLRMTRIGSEFFTFRLEAHYKDVLLSPARPKACYVEFREQIRVPKFIRIMRSLEREQQAMEVFQILADNHGSMLPDELSLYEPDALEWLATHYETIRKSGFELIQDFEGQKYNFARPDLKIKVTENDKGFVINANVRFENIDVPLPALRDNVLKQKPAFRLPDKTQNLLPAAFLNRLRHLFEVATPEGDTLTVRRAHATVVSEVVNNPQPASAALAAPALVAGGAAPPLVTVTGGNGGSGGKVFVPKSLQVLEQLNNNNLPDNIQVELREYQRAGYDWLCFLNEFGLNGILADDMGLGKTVQALTMLQREKERGGYSTTLVVVPNSLMFNWEDEIKRFTPGLSVTQYAGPRRDLMLEHLMRYDVVLTTYGTVRQDVEKLQGFHFHYIILDESQLIKNRDAKTTRAVLQLQSNYRLSLTGTPIENSTLDLWTQMNFLNPGLLGSESFFEKFYAIPIEREQNAARADQLRRLIRPYILRRTKEQVAQDLPPRIDQTYICEMLPDQRRLYDETRQLYRKTFFGKGQGGIMEHNKLQILTSLSRLRQIAIHPALIDPTVRDSGKYDLMWSLLREVLAAGNKVLVFSQFVKLLKMVEFDLKREGIVYAYLDGSTRERRKAVNTFQQDDDVKVFLISLKAGGVGLNLTAAQYVFVLDPWWNPAIEQQAINRAHRIGQSQTVFAYKFITEDSIEEKILLLQQRKAELAGDIIRNDSQIFKFLTHEELTSLFD